MLSDKKKQLIDTDPIDLWLLRQTEVLEKSACMLQACGTTDFFKYSKAIYGAPFTKDIVYLEGLLRVHNFLRAIVANGRADCLKLLFCGKLDIEDLPVIHTLSAVGLCKPPQYLPPWASDLRLLLSYLAYSSFLNGINFGQVKAHYQKMLEQLPVTSGN